LADLLDLSRRDVSATMFGRLSWTAPLVGAGIVFAFVLLTTPPGFRRTDAPFGWAARSQRRGGVP
jgi:hypothetical protein